MGKHRKKSGEEYMEKFKSQFEKLNYIPQEGEVIVQCGEGYPNYWFLSNKGYLFSSYHKDVQIIKPNFDKIGKPNKEGQRAGNAWRYGTHGGTGLLDRFTMAKMMAEHFCENEFASDETIETHHVRKRASFKEHEPQKCNRADMLQNLPKSIHAELTHYARTNFDEIDKEFEIKAKKSNCPVYQCTQDQLDNIALQAVRGCWEQDMKLVMYTMTLEDDPLLIESEAHPIKSIS